LPAPLAAFSHWLQAALLAERSRWVLWLPVALGTGIALYFGLPFEPSGPFVLLLVLVVMAVSALAVLTRTVFLRACLALAIAVALGFLAAKLREELVAAPVLSARIGPTVLDGRVAYAEPHGKSIRVLLDDVKSREIAASALPYRIRISFRAGAGALVPGERIYAMAVLMPPPGPAAPGAYDFGRAAFFDRIGAVGYAYGKPRLIGKPPPPGLFAPLALAIAHLRWHMTMRLHEVLPGSEGSIASALITGERGGISESDEQALRDAGLAHVLAIAGLHMALVGLGLFWVVRAFLALIPVLALTYPIKKWAAAAALGGAFFYLVVSGAAAPTIRAFTMLAMMLIAILVDRPALSMRSVALAATILLVFEPESLVEPGFQMSFAAVVGLIAVAEWEQARATQRIPWGPAWLGSVRRYMRGIATTSFVGSVATVPYAIYHFDRATHYAVLGNLLAMPIMGFVVMPSAAVAVLAMPFGLDAWPLRAMGFGIETMLAVGRWVSQLPGAVTVMPAWPVSALVLISLGGLWCALWRRRWRWLGLAPAALGVLIALNAPVPDILIGRDGRTIAVRNAHGMLKLLPSYRDGWSANEWLKRDGDEHVAEDATATRADGVACDATGCVAHLKDGRLLAAPLRADALAEDCGKADIVVSAVVITAPCEGPRLVIDRHKIEESDGYAIVLTAPLDVATVTGARGERPWSPRLSDLSSGGSARPAGPAP
jgi:competence protein ComEC